MPHKFSYFITKKIRQRAKFLCEYCHSNERWQLIPFTIDHIISISNGGTDELENLAFACFHCNRHKSNKQLISNIPIFNLREMNWREHFFWSKDYLKILAKTKTGKVISELLQMNRPRIIQIRKDDILINRHPPKDD